MPAHRSQLEVDEDLAFQRGDWVFERIGWVGLLLAVLAAIAGVFGHGPVSRRTAVAADGSARVEYGRFERHGAATEMTLALRRRAPSDTSVWLWVDVPFLEGVQLARVIPEPLTERSDARFTTFEIALAPRADSARVSLRFTPDRIGAHTIRLGIVGAAGMQLDQFVYP